MMMVRMMMMMMVGMMTMMMVKDDDEYYGPTLQEALDIQGVGFDSFIRESVAALLNAASDDVNYKYSVPEVIEMTQKAIVSGDYNDALEEFIEYNNLGGSSLCPYS